MKKAKAPRVPVLEDALEINLPKLMRATKASGDARLVLSHDDVRTVVLLSDSRLAAFLGGRAWVADIVTVKCLGGRLRPLLKCPRAHEGNFQSLYYLAGGLACRHCHGLRYKSNLAPSSAERSRIARNKLLETLGAESGDVVVSRRPHKWRRRHRRLITRLGNLSRTYYNLLKDRLSHERASS